MSSRHAATLVAVPSFLAALSLLGGIAACSASGGRAGFDATQDAPTEPAPGASATGGFDPTPPPPAPPPPENAEVFGHSPSTLYLLDPKTKQVAKVADFTGCSSVVDIALDEASNIWATANGGGGGLYKVDKTSAKCTLVKAGSYPNSLSFVPKGTLDANAEALVGYLDGTYVRISTQDGSITNVGSLSSGDLVSSGDIVSVKGSDDGKTPGKTFLTVKNGGGKSTCTNNDCLVEVDPKTGKVVKFWGNIGFDSVFGLAFWGGSVFGFTDGGDLFEVTFNGSQLATAKIPVPNAPAGLKFWGAGSTTSAPIFPVAK
jgi:hypothetical protein